MADLSRSLEGRTVLGIFAHPDDESLACGGTLARLADAGARVVIVCASHGEAGSICDPALVPDPTDPANLEQTTGRGLLLIRAFMDEVRFRKLEPGTEITLIKRVHAAASDHKEASQ